MNSNHNPNKVKAVYFQDSANVKDELLFNI